MNNEGAKRFVETYQDYFFGIPADKRNEGKYKLGITIVHPTEKQYDFYIYLAVKALQRDICPKDVFVGEKPKKLTVNMLIEYQDGLANLFSGTDYYKNKGFISKELERALWVYGHATRKYA